MSGDLPPIPGLKIIAGTGSRSFDNPTIRGDLEHHLAAAVAQSPDLRVMSGGAEGWDEAVAFTAIRLDIPLILAIPHQGYGRYYWGKHSVTGEDRYGLFQVMLSCADEVHYICKSLYETFEGRRQHSNFIRNAYMVDAGDEFVVFNSASRGTAHCFARIVEAGKPYRIFS